MQNQDTRQVADEIKTVVDGAQRQVVLVSPYLTLGGNDFIGSAIRRALRREVEVELFWRIDDYRIVDAGQVESSHAVWLTSLPVDWIDRNVKVGQLLLEELVAHGNLHQRTCSE